MAIVKFDKETMRVLRINVAGTIAVRCFCTMLLASIFFPLQAQEDSDNEGESSESSVTFRPGLYSSFDNFINNDPIPVAWVETSLDKEDRSFYHLLFLEKKVVVNSPDSSYTINLQKMWGYSDGESVFINRDVFPKAFLEGIDIHEYEWARINIFGKISLVFFIKKVVDRTVKYINPLTTNRSNPKLKAAEFFLDTRTGEVHKVKDKEFESLINDDPEVLAEFKKNRDKDTRIYVVLKQYNMKHPFEFRR